MKRSPVLLLALAAAALGCGGCSHIPFIGKKRPHVEKQSRQVATDSEREFQGRWVDKRAGELVSQGQSQEAARTQAEREFNEKFPATTIAQSASHP